MRSSSRDDKHKPADQRRPHLADPGWGGRRRLCS